MKKYLIFLVLGLFLSGIHAQNITWATPAKLQVYALTTSGEQLMMTSENLLVTYDQLKMTGELDLGSFQTSHDILKNLLDSAGSNQITLSAMIPEGKFVYRDMVEEKFPVETEMRYGETVSQIILVYEISNRRTSLANTFDITVTGSISLKDDLGITRETGLDDRISYMFFQNVQTRTY